MTALKLSIDKHHLDLECLRQVDMREAVCMGLVETEGRAAALKAARDLLRAQLLQIGRNQPEQLGLWGSPTVDALNAAVECDQEYQTADAAWREAHNELAQLKAADRVLDDRRRMLEHLVQLHGRDYWAAPRVSNEDAAKVTDSTLTAAIGGVVRRRKGGQ